MDSDLILYENLELLTEKDTRDIFVRMRSNMQLTFKYMKSLVVGQEDTIKELSLKLINYRAYPFLNHNSLFVTGPSGCGKTYSIENLCKFLKIPFSIINSPTMTPESYIGSTVMNQVNNAKYDLKNQPMADDLRKKCNSKLNTYGIIYFDEFGKLLNKKNSQGNWGQDIQSTLLKVIEPNYYSDASILFIFADAMSMSSERNLTRQDLINLGFISELAGRIQIIKPFESLTKENYLDILKLPSGHLYKKMKISQLSGIKFDVYDGALDYIAELALKDNLGARSLSYIIDSIFDTATNDLMFSNSEIGVIKLDSTSVRKYAKNLTITKQTNENDYQEDECMKNEFEQFISRKSKKSSFNTKKSENLNY